MSSHRMSEASPPQGKGTGAAAGSRCSWPGCGQAADPPARAFLSAWKDPAKRCHPRGSELATFFHLCFPTRGLGLVNGVCTWNMGLNTVYIWVRNVPCVPSTSQRVGVCSHRSRLFTQGILDIVVLSRGHTRSDLAIHALKNNFEADAYFVKVIGECSVCALLLAFTRIPAMTPVPSPITSKARPHLPVGDASSLRAPGARTHSVSAVPVPAPQRSLADPGHTHPAGALSASACVCSRQVIVNVTAVWSGFRMGVLFRFPGTFSIDGHVVCSGQFHLSLRAMPSPCSCSRENARPCVDVVRADVLACF